MTELELQVQNLSVTEQERKFPQETEQEPENPKENEQVSQAQLS